MSRVSIDKLFEVTVGMIKHQDRQMGTWLLRLLAVEGGFAISIAAVVAWYDPSSGFPIKVVVSGLALLALLLGGALHAIVLRELAWQKGYVESAKLIEGEKKERLLYREGMVQGGTKFGTTLWFVTWVLSITWVILIIASLCTDLLQK